jgi:hypothetical protein
MNVMNHGLILLYFAAFPRGILAAPQSGVRPPDARGAGSGNCPPGSCAAVATPGADAGAECEKG